MLIFEIVDIMHILCYYYQQTPLTMRTIYITLCLVLCVCFNTARAQVLTQVVQDNLLATADSAYTLMKYDLPTSVLMKELPYFVNVLQWDSTTIRRFVFSMGHIESGGKVNSEGVDKDMGYLQVRQIAVDDYLQHPAGKKGPQFTAADLRNPANGYEMVRLMPLRILNDICSRRKLVQFRDIFGVWSSGAKGYKRNPDASAHHYAKFEFSYNYCVGAMELDGRAQICNPLPGMVLLQ